MKQEMRNQMVIVVKMARKRQQKIVESLKFEKPHDFFRYKYTWGIIRFYRRIINNFDREREEFVLKLLFFFFSLFLFWRPYRSPIDKFTLFLKRFML